MWPIAESEWACVCLNMVEVLFPFCFCLRSKQKFDLLEILRSWLKFDLLEILRHVIRYAVRCYFWVKLCKRDSLKRFELVQK